MTNNPCFLSNIFAFLLRTCECNVSITCSLDNLHTLSALIKLLPSPQPRDPLESLEILDKVVTLAGMELTVSPVPQVLTGVTEQRES